MDCLLVYGPIYMLDCEIDGYYAAKTAIIMGNNNKCLLSSGIILIRDS